MRLFTRSRTLRPESRATPYSVTTLSAIERGMVTTAPGVRVALMRLTVPFAAVDGRGKTVAKSWTLPCYYRAVEQETVELTVTGLASGEYTLVVTAENAYGDASEPVEAQVTVDDGGCPYCHQAHEGFSGKLVLFFHKIAFFFTRLFGKA